MLRRLRIAREKWTHPMMLSVFGADYRRWDILDVSGREYRVTRVMTPEVVRIRRTMRQCFKDWRNPK